MVGSESDSDDPPYRQRPPDVLTEEDLKHTPRRGCSGWGDTPLHAACGNDRVGVCRILAGRLGGGGIPLYAARSERDGASPLLRACEGDSVGCIEALVAVGADINARNNSGESPLYIALSRKNDDVARCVFKHGGKVMPRDGVVMRRFTMVRRQLEAEASKAALAQQRDAAASATSERTAAYDAEFGTTDFVAELERMKLEMGGGGAGSGGGRSGGSAMRGGTGGGETRAPQPKSEAQKAKAARRRKAKKAAQKAKKAAAAASALAAPAPAAGAVAPPLPAAAAVAPSPPRSSARAPGAAVGAAAGARGAPSVDVDESDSEVEDYDEVDDIVLE